MPLYYRCLESSNNIKASMFGNPRGFEKAEDVKRAVDHLKCDYGYFDKVVREELMPNILVGKDIIVQFVNYIELTKSFHTAIISVSRTQE